MPFELDGFEPLDTFINVRVTTEEKQRLRSDAGTAGLSVSAFARRRLMGRPVLAKHDEAVVRELRRMGGLAKHIYLEGKRVNPKETKSILVAIREYIETLTGELDDSQKS
jgi:hypothetical protein